MNARLLKVGAYILMLAFSSCKSCKKEVRPDPLPPETQTGANTFGCLIDGQPWIPNGGGGFSGIPPISGGFYLDNKTVFLLTSMKDGRRLDIYVKNVNAPGTYNLNFDTFTIPSPTGGFPENYGLYRVRNQVGVYTNYMTTTQYTGKVVFTKLDTTAKLLAGTFEFDAVDKTTGNVVKITNGRFDIDQNTLK
jgi:hypothetical protein